MKELLNLVAEQSTATLGSLTRAWLCVMAALWLLIVLYMNACGYLPFRGHMAASLIVGLYGAVFASIPVTAVFIIFYIARKW